MTQEQMTQENLAKPAATAAAPIKLLYSEGEFQICAVYQQMTPRMKAAVIQLWNRNRILPQGVDPRQRANEVASLLLRKGHVVGVSTVAQMRLSEIGLDHLGDNPFYFFRMFIQPQDRKPMMMLRMERLTVDFLEAEKRPDKPRGVVQVLDNRKIERPGMRRYFDRRGYETHHKTKRGLTAYIKHFSAEE